MELKQKFAMCWTLIHLCLLKMPGLPKSPRGGKIAFDFMIRMLTGTNGTGLFTSLIASTIHGHELNIASHSTIKVCKDSVSKLLSWLLSKQLSIALAERVCLSQILPKWLAFGGLFFQTIQSAPYEPKKWVYHFMWTGPVAIKVNNVPHLFSSDLFFFHCKWSKHI